MRLSKSPRRLADRESLCLITISGNHAMNGDAMVRRPTYPVVASCWCCRLLHCSLCHRTQCMTMHTVSCLNAVGSAGHEPPTAPSEQGRRGSRLSAALLAIACSCVTQPCSWRLVWAHRIICLSRRLRHLDVVFAGELPHHRARCGWAALPHVRMLHVALWRLKFRELAPFRGSHIT